MKPFFALGIAGLVGVGSAAGYAALVTGAAGCASAGTAFADAGRQDAGSDSGAQSDAPMVADDSVQVGSEPSCATTGPDFAPILDGTGSFQCVRVGPAAAPLEGMYADSTGRLTPFAYVRAGATDPAPDGTMAHPYATIDAALAGMPAVRTIFLSNDTAHVAPSAPFARSIDIVGAGDRFTVMVAASAGGTATAPTYTLSAQGLGTDVVVEALTIDGSSLTDPSVAAGARVTTGASITLRNAVIAGVARGVQAESASTVHTDGLLVRDAGVVGISLAGGSDGDIKNTEVEHTAGPGIFATDSHVSVSVAWVHGSTVVGGVVLSGGITGATDQLDRLTVQENAGVGAAFAAGASVNVLHLLASGTTAGSSGGGGFGMVVTGGANVTTDPSIASDTDMGHGSWFGLNAGSGVVADGAMGATPSDLELNGAMVRDNGGAGVIFQDGAVGRQVAYSIFEHNRGAGAIVAGDARFGLLKCDGFIANVLSALTFEHGPETLGDGLIVAYMGSAATSLVVEGSVFDSNARYGAYFVGASVTLQGNTGLMPSGQQVAADSTAMVNGYGGVPSATPLGDSAPTGTESLSVPAFAAP